MRAVTERVCKAWQQCKSKKVGNTSTDGFNIYLHGNCIVRMDMNGSVYISDGGWQTPTTRERLNGVLRTMGIKAHVYQRDHALYFNGTPWDGSWLMVR